MCDYDARHDMTRLESYVTTRPFYVQMRKQAYADWALDELLGYVIAEMEKPSYYECGEEEVPIPYIIKTYISKMRRLRNIAPPGKRMMFSIAIKEAESLKAIFEKGNNYED